MKIWRNFYRKTIQLTHIEDKLNRICKFKKFLQKDFNFIDSNLTRIYFRHTNRIWIDDDKKIFRNHKFCLKFHGCFSESSCFLTSRRRVKRSQTIILNKHANTIASNTPLIYFTYLPEYYGIFSFWEFFTRHYFNFHAFVYFRVLSFHLHHRDFTFHFSYILFKGIRF